MTTVGGRKTTETECYRAHVGFLTLFIEFLTVKVPRETVSEDMIAVGRRHLHIITEEGTRSNVTRFEPQTFPGVAGWYMSVLTVLAGRRPPNVPDSFNPHLARRDAAGYSDWRDDCYIAHIVLLRGLHNWLAYLGEARFLGKMNEIAALGNYHYGQIATAQRAGAVLVNKQADSVFIGVSGYYRAVIAHVHSCIESMPA